jgi:threonine dehydratase
MMQSVSLKQAELEIVIEARDQQHVIDTVAELLNAGFNVRTDSDLG